MFLETLSSIESEVLLLEDFLVSIVVDCIGMVGPSIITTVVFLRSWST